MSFKKNKVNIPVADPFFTDKELAYASDAIRSTWISSRGAYVNKFEQAFAGFVKTKYASTVCNGTAALHLALLALDVKPGDEVIVPNFTFIATANAIAYCGAKPVFVDVLPDTWNINPREINRKISSRTRGIIPVHLYGNPADMTAVNALAHEHGLFVVEDAAEAHGALYEGKLVGGLSDLGVFSFFGNKILTTGEGGMVVSNNSKLMDLISLYKNQGRTDSSRYVHEVIGYNYRMTNVQAAIGLAQLENIHENIKRRQWVAQQYRKQLQKVPGISFQVEQSNCTNIHWMITVLIGDEFGISRDQLMAYLRAQGIETKPAFEPCTSMPFYSSTESFPVTEKLAKEGLSLPSSSTLTSSQIEYITDSVRCARK